MIFTEPRFFAFFAFFFTAYWTLQGNRSRKWLLLAASYLFYSAWDPRFSTLLMLSTAIDFAVGNGIARNSEPRSRKLWLSASLIGNLGILATFKYYDFFATSASQLLQSLGLAVDLPLLSVILPVGISFYTFQTLSYSLDVYRGTLKPCQDALDFALFVAFFPQLVAGPIVRATDFLPQLETARRFTQVEVRACLALFLIGYVKKACIADQLAAPIDRVFADPGAFDSTDNWLGLLLYQVQIYCDFSGYSDMALATAGLLGFRLCLNFDFPFFASSIVDFWRRWHISLSTWLRDYLYISLGGGRGSGTRFVRNTITTFALCGLWHGAAWNFVIFGVVHGVYVVVNRWTSTSKLLEKVPPTLRFVAGVVITNLLFALSLVIFRAESTAACRSMFDRLATPAYGGTASLHAGLWLLLVALALVHFCFWRGVFTRLSARVPDFLFSALLGIGWALALFFTATDYQPFAYFQF